MTGSPHPSRAASVAASIIVRAREPKEMTKVRKRYIVDDIDEYTMEFVQQQDGTYRIYCRDHPFCPFDTSPHKTHLYESGLICVTAGREPRSLEQAVAIAHVWMKGYSSYCHSGVFPNGKARVDVN